MDVNGFTTGSSLNGVLMAFNAKNYGIKVFWFSLLVMMFICAGFFSLKTIQTYLDNPVYTMSYTTTEKEIKIELPDIVFCFAFHSSSLHLFPGALNPNQTCPPYFYITVEQANVAQMSTCDIAEGHIWHGIAKKTDKAGTHLIACYRIRVPYALVSPKLIDTTKAWFFTIYYLPLVQYHVPKIFLLPWAEAFSIRDYAEEHHLSFLSSTTVMKFGPPLYSHLLPSDMGGSCRLLSEQDLPHYGLYSEKNCRFECVINATLRKFGCYPVKEGPFQIDYSLANYSMCSDDKDFGWSFATTECVQQCLPACRKWKHEVLKEQFLLHEKDIEDRWITFDNMVGTGDAVNVSAMISSYDVDRTSVAPFSKVWIAFNSRAELRVNKEKNAMGLERLVSNIGGLMGLYLGISMISLAQLVLFCVRYLHGKCGTESADVEKVESDSAHVIRF